MDVQGTSGDPVVLLISSRSLPAPIRPHISWQTERGTVILHQASQHKPEVHCNDPTESLSEPHLFTTPVLSAYGGEIGTLRDPKLARTRLGILSRMNGWGKRRTRRGASDFASATQ